MRRFRAAWVVLAFTLAAGAALGQSIELDKDESDQLRLLYLDPFQSHLVPLVKQRFQTSLDFQKEIFDWEPYDKPTVVLQDFSDYGGGAALISPTNLVLLDIAPKNHTLETLPGSERFYMLMNHELVHVATMDSWNAQDRFWRRLFGGKVRQTDDHPISILYNYLTTPRLSTPRWYGEGSAVFMETWMSGGIGRAQGGYDEMVFRSMVRDDAHFYSNLGLVSKGTGVDFQVGVNAYLYGTRFISYLGLVHSPQKVIEWFSRGEDSKRYYSRQFEHVFGKPLEQAWDEWIAWEHEFQRANLESVRRYPLTERDYLTAEGLGSASRSFIDHQTGELIGAFRYPGVVAHVGVVDLDSGAARRVTDIKGPALYRVTSPAYDAETRTLFYTADNNAYRDLMAVDLDTGKSRMLLKDARIGDLVFNPNAGDLWGLRHLNGYVTLVRIPPPYDNWTQVHTWPYGEVLFDMDLSPDGTLMSASMGGIDGKQFLRVFRIEDLRGEDPAEPLAEFGFGTAIPEGFVFAPDGRYLFGSSYYTGVSNIFRCDLETGEFEAVSNAETGFFRPIPMANGRLLVYEFGGDGFRPALIDPVVLDHVGSIRFLGNEIARKHPVVRDWVVGAPKPVSAGKGGGDNKYRPGDEIGFSSWYPVIEGYRDTEALGWHMRFADPLQLNSLELTASYTLEDDLPSDEKVHLNLEYQTPNWRFQYYHNGADFYDLFGPTERSRRGDAYIVEYDRSLIYDLPRRMKLELGAGYYTGLDTLPANQNVSTGFDNLLITRGELSYEHLRKSLGAVDHEKGFRWDLVASTAQAGGDNVPKLRGGFDFGFALPWKHSSVWFYNSAGYAEGRLDNPLASYYFGGFKNNYVDDREVKRYREYDSFPGFEIDAIAGQTFTKSVVEWNLPPIRFEEVGSPELFLSWLRPALFVGAMVTDPDDSALDRTWGTAGFQVDLNFTLIHRLPMTLSVGYAAGFRSSDKIDDEWMISLKVL